MPDKKKKIEISVELQQEISKAFSVSTRSVRSAMNFDSNSPSARMLRSYALNHGGILFQEVDNPYRDTKIL